MLTYADIQAAMPDSKLRHGAQWLFSPKPFVLSKGEARQIQSLGHPLAKFQRASESIYQRSSSGKLPAWIAELLDAGKPQWLIDQQKSPTLQGVVPRVIRPDLILTENGFALTELDSVPGGMGITTWLTQLYSDAGFDILGGRDGVPKGFGRLLPEGGKVLVSEESEDYRPEMEWLCAQVGKGFEVSKAEESHGDEEAAYRFFEWFDWENIPAAQQLAAKSALTPPCKPHLEEKLWLSLLWSPVLQPLWEKELRGAHLARIRKVVPYSWVMDPSPLPPHATLPRLEVNSWDEVKHFSQKLRHLVVKVSGFSELAWGSKSVQIGHDMPTDEWSEAIQTALDQYSSQPWVMQQFEHGKLVEHPYFDPETHEPKLMQGRARLCPYYFIDERGQTSLGGVLATIVPADKKKIHGMKDGILVPCVIG